MGRLFDLWRRFIGALVVIVLVVLVVPFLLVAAIVGAGYVALTSLGRKAAAPVPPPQPAPQALAAFNRASAAIVAADFAELELMADEWPGFPLAMDPFLRHPWFNIALKGGPAGVVGWMIRRGVDIDAYDPSGFCPLMVACDRDDGRAVEMLALLVDAGAAINCADALGSTPLHHAAAHAPAEVVELLLSRGADPFAASHDNVPVTPIDLARERKRPDIVAILERHMAGRT